MKTPKTPKLRMYGRKRDNAKSRWRPIDFKSGSFARRVAQATAWDDREGAEKMLAEVQSQNDDLEFKIRAGKASPVLAAVAALAVLAGCGQAPVELPEDLGASNRVAVADAAPADPVDDSGSGGTAVPSATPVTITLYSKSKSEAPVAGWPTKTYTATGSCFVYAAKTYCFDDGLKVLSWSSGGNNYGPYGYTYFGVGRFGANMLTFNGHGSLNLDEMPQSKVRAISFAMESNMLVASATVLTTGSASQVSCMDDGAGQLDCGTFTVDLNQASL